MLSAIADVLTLRVQQILCLLNKKNLCISVEYLKKICVFLWSFGHPSVDFRFWQNGQHCSGPCVKYEYRITMNCNHVTVTKTLLFLQGR
jgi:hypothetical protein